MEATAFRTFPAACSALFLVSGLTLFLTFTAKAAGKAKPVPATPVADPCAEVQPATEKLGLNAHQRIRDEEMSHSHIMEFGSALMDGAGPRLRR
jgi:hypothetical protein